MCVCQRKHTATTYGISVAGTWFPSEESATDLGPWMDHRAWDCPLESDGSGENAVSRQTVETLHTGLWKNPGGPSAYVYTLESQHQGYHEEPHKPMDHGDCQGSLHSSWSRIWPSDGTWGQSPFSIMAYNCQVALPDILSAAFWKSSGVFQNLYLRDMACITDGMSTLGPVMVAQEVVDPGHLHPPP